MTKIDIKNLHSDELHQIKNWCEEEIKFRNSIGKEIGIDFKFFEYRIQWESLKQREQRLGYAATLNE